MNGMTWRPKCNTLAERDMDNGLEDFLPVFFSGVS